MKNIIQQKKNLKSYVLILTLKMVLTLKKFKHYLIEAKTKLLTSEYIEFSFISIILINFIFRFKNLETI